MAEKNSNVTWYVHHIVTAILIISGHFLPVVEPLTREGTVLLMAFIGAIYGWSFINMLWPSVLAILSMGMQLGMAKVLAAGLGSHVTWMLIFFFLIVGIFTETKFVDNISAWFLTRKIVLGKPWVLFTVMLFGNYVCSLLNGFGSLIIFLTLTFKMCELMDIKPYTKFPTMIGMGIVLTTALSAIAFPFQGTGLMFVMAWGGITGSVIDYIGYMAVSFPISIFVIVLYVLISKFIIRIDVSPLKNFDPAAAGITLNKVTGEQKLAIVAMVWALFDLCAPAVLPKDWLLVRFLNSLTQFGQAALPIVVFMVIKYKDKPVIEFQRLAAKYVPWELFMMMGVIMPLASFLTADTTGIKQMMTTLVQPLLGLGTVGFLLLIMGITCILTNFANNFVVGMIMMPVLYAFSLVTDGLSASAALMVLIFMTHFAFLTPGATPFAAIMLSNTNWVRTTDAFKWGIPTILVLFLCTLPVAYFWATMIL